MRRKDRQHASMEASESKFAWLQGWQSNSTLLYGILFYRDMYHPWQMGHLHGMLARLEMKLHHSSTAEIEKAAGVKYRPAARKAQRS